MASIMDGSILYPLAESWKPASITWDWKNLAFICVESNVGILIML